MKPIFVTALVLSLGFLTGCSSTEWVHPNKPTSEFTNEYNRCQNLVLRDPKLQQGNQFLMINATERCLQRDGWRIIEKE